MGTSENHCRTVAVRYRFVSCETDGDVKVKFEAHPVVELEVDEVVGETPPNEPETSEVVFLDDVDYLRSLDPKEWKKQDHYRVLGIKDLRFEASDDVIKTAYRKIVLKHHPDKRKAMGEEIRPDDDYFTCITMAYETLGTLSRRRAYDSVDPEFDDSLPSSAELKQDFFEVFGRYFNLNARWSERQPVPKIGGPANSRDQVDRFYSFWYEFKSWREFSYEDEEDKDKCTDRDERRMCEKMNRVERQRKKKEEMVRIRNLVDMAYNADPRIARFKQEDKDRKLAAKRARQSAAQAKKEEEERMMKEAQLAREKAEAAERARIEAKRQEREVQKRALKKERKTLRDTCKTNNYYAQSEDENLAHIQAVDKLCEALSLTELEELNRDLVSNGQVVFVKAMKEYEARVEKEQKETVTLAKPAEQAKPAVNGHNLSWSQEHIQLLIKAVNLFPAGTNQRWEVVANFINQHGNFADGSAHFNAKDVLAKAKNLQNTDFSKNDLKEAANRQAFNNFEKDKRPVAVPSDITRKANGGEEAESAPWTAVEQQLLEQALKTYPASAADRWDKIAACVPGRTKKDCMKRYKELVEIVKAKKAAQAALHSK